MPPHPLTNFEIQKYSQNEPRFNGVYSSDNLQKNKGWGNLINLLWLVFKKWLNAIFMKLIIYTQIKITTNKAKHLLVENEFKS